MVYGLHSTQLSQGDLYVCVDHPEPGTVVEIRLHQRILGTLNDSFRALSQLLRTCITIA